MNIEKYTERARGFIQSAQSLAMRDGHQQFSPLHMLKVLLDDSEGMAGGLIDRAGGNSRAILKATEEALGKLPKVSGSGAGQIYLAPDLARAFDAAEKAADKAGDSFVTVERLLLGLALDKDSEAGSILRKGGPLIASVYLWPLFAMALGYTFLFLTLWTMRIQTEILNRRARSLMLAGEL